MFKTVVLLALMALVGGIAPAVEKPRCAVRVVRPFEGQSAIEGLVFEDVVFPGNLDSLFGSERIVVVGRALSAGYGQETPTDGR